ncbi:MAG: crossover junction endodeoxyribonuclease RuvC [Candidatus Zambryskibacteria bacterium RIFCSPLOWO2_02_FULL_51_21]|uniref:Crossover junction endodeoxyribonuclease RuvC n=1 Tax=Candidatus Zambryskibacteria bacterium RIFCSPHIGHO2_02_FULL_43_37 TaxID=1802749 RepID=A0A1G2TGC4_9BACT|nr:MAG: crossover junction endodeoxyribonuclease RuvC [Candidatus Zambryskibacteria bacterium RIFCSPHIGHO2_01_FULL_52_18]OHA96337.1 MAG: crossover junction endodeoxyribonuclease RuvC [Candidatus Zambryskibacteria bacterium RIFCSPHIGHO2_02_FULL_43_37]OHB07740.1 MAG: crossover junction endodeoxyribonuclease RuvC [Candidatus Zambryskibacteria bacterium RIFCSPLOWO2_01_FULL_52_12]OHB11403.1 MAG: crossover junction endodeoxyribonuclease RuvC [Candidatus Zambryskibacteria bacterium RIFCSPLOWO2_02_FULL_
MTKSRKSTPTRNRVAAIDPGFDRLGIAVVEGEKVLFSGCVETNRKIPHQERLLEIGCAIEAIIKKWKPNALAIEQLFFNQNATNALRVAEARGVALYEAAKAGLKVYEYSPQAVKIAVTGYGKADKKQVESMVRKLIKLDKAKKLDDELDAIALGITHIASQKHIW